MTEAIGAPRGVFPCPRGGRQVTYRVTRSRTRVVLGAMPSRGADRTPRQPPATMTAVMSPLSFPRWG
jgi:hypothetical protein